MIVFSYIWVYLWYGLLSTQNKECIRANNNTTVGDTNLAVILIKGDSINADVNLLLAYAACYQE
jgi:hypothetical protein